MSLKKNILANYLSQFYVTGIGIVTVPLYIEYLGAEAYGLIGFFAMLQIWFNLLDVGLTPTVSRETARYRGGATDPHTYRSLIRALECAFLVLAIVGGVTLYASAKYISTDWLQAVRLPAEEVQHTIELMALIAALRLMCGIYRGAIGGAEQLVWLSKFNATIATLRFVAILPILIYIGSTLQLFFEFQLGVALLEIGCLYLYAYRLLPVLSDNGSFRWYWPTLKPAMSFAFRIAFTSSLWVAATQSDKLILSKALPLGDYATYVIAVLAASGVSLVTSPVIQALQPRMSKLYAEGNESGALDLYRSATQLICTLCIPVALMLAFFPDAILWAWTGNSAISQQAAPVLRLYALGNGVLAVGSVAHSLQIAKGDLRLHLIETPLFLLILLPVLFWSVQLYGIEGAGYSWFFTSALFFIFWLPIIHQNFLDGKHMDWLLNDVGKIFYVALASVLLGFCTINYYKLIESLDRLTLISVILSLGVGVAILSALGSSYCRRMFIEYLRN